MNGNKIYRITDGMYTPKGRWDEYDGLMDFKHCANTIAKIIEDTDDEEFERILKVGFTIWGCSLEIVIIHAGGRVDYDADCEPAEGKYIATAATRAIADRMKQRKAL